jgi:urease accessory protein UreE
MSHAITLVQRLEDGGRVRHRAEVETSSGRRLYVTLPYPSKRMAVLMALHWADANHIAVASFPELAKDLHSLFLLRADAGEA